MPDDDILIDAYAGSATPMEARIRASAMVMRCMLFLEFELNPCGTGSVQSFLCLQKSVSDLPHGNATKRI